MRTPSGDPNRTDRLCDRLLRHVNVFLRFYGRMKTVIRRERERESVCVYYRINNDKGVQDPDILLLEHVGQPGCFLGRT